MGIRRIHVGYSETVSSPDSIIFIMLNDTITISKFRTRVLRRDTLPLTLSSENEVLGYIFL